MRRRLLSILLVLCMCLSLFPAPAIAAEVPTAAETPAQDLDKQITGIKVLGESGETGTDEAAELAFDGDYSKKWCDNTGDPADTGWLAFQLQEPAVISRMKVYHASSHSKDPKTCNTLQFSLETLKDPAAYEAAEDKQAFLAAQENWKSLVDVDNSTQQPITDTTVPVAQPVSICRLNVTDGDNRAEWTAVRIHEIELFTPLETVTVTFAGGEHGTSGGPAAVTKVKNDTYDLPENSFQAEGRWYFTGWQVGEDSTPKQPGETITLSADITVTALWEEGVMATFEPGSCEGQTPTGTVAAQTVKSGEEIRLPACDFVMTGWYFTGWQVGEGADLMQPDELLTLSADTVITAQWVKGVTATFGPGTCEGQTPTGAVDAQTVKPGEEIRLPACDFVMTGWYFTGWKVGDSADLLQPKEKVVLTADTEVMAQWVKGAVVTFAPGTYGDNQVPENTMEPWNVKPGEEITLPKCTYKALGQQFVIWSVQVGDSPAVKMAPGEAVTISADTTVTALWAVGIPEMDTLIDGSRISILAVEGKTEDPNRGPEKMFDGDRRNTEWSAHYNARTLYIALDQPALLTAMTVYLGGQSCMADEQSNVAGFNLQAFKGTEALDQNHLYPEDANWETLATVEGNDKDVLTVPLTMEEPRQYYRLQLTDAELGDESSRYYHFYEMELMERVRITDEVTLNFAAGSADADGALEPRTVQRGTCHVLPRSPYTRPGYDFVGWSVQAGTAPAVVQRPYERFTASDNVTITALWEAEHKHADDAGKEQVWKPYVDYYDLADTTVRYFYAPRDLHLDRVHERRGKTVFCLNGKHVTGTLNGGDKDVVIFDPTGQGVLDGVNGMAVEFLDLDDDMGRSLYLKSGTLTRTGTPGPIYQSIWQRAGSFWLDGGTMDQKTEAPAILIDNYYDNDVYLRGGTITSTAREHAAIEFQDSGTVYLSGTPEIIVPEGCAHIKTNRAIEAMSSWGGIPYRGGNLVIDCGTMNNNAVVVKHVDDNNWMKFSPLDPAKKFIRSGENLLLMDADAHEVTLSFVLGDNVEGQGPDPITNYTDMVARMPGYKNGDKTFSKQGYGFMGWQLGDKVWHPGQAMRLAQDETLTAVWMKLPEQDTDGYYMVRTQDDFETLANYCNVLFAESPENGNNKFNIRLMNDLTLAGEYPLLGRHDVKEENAYSLTFNAPYCGIFDGNGKTITIDRRFDPEEHGGIINHSENGTQVLNLTVKGTARVSGFRDDFGGIVGGSAGITFRNCTSSLDILADRQSPDLGVYNVAGFLGSRYEYGGRTTFENCVFDGSIRVAGRYKKGGSFFGFSCANISSGVILTNCLMAGTLTGADRQESDNSNAFFRKNDKGLNGAAVTNCYYLKDAVTFNGKPVACEQGTEATLQQMTSGEICWLLNGSKADGLWKQTLGSDANPVLDPTHKTVYQQGAGYVNETGTVAVIFQIVNGTWKENDKTLYQVYLTGGDKLTALPTPQPQLGYMAGTWNQEPNTNDAINNSVTYTYTCVKDASQDCTIRFNQGVGALEGTGMPDVTWTKGKPYTLPVPPAGAFTYEQHDFSCWSVENGGTTETHYVGDAVIPAGDMVLAAQWVPIHKHRTENGNWGTFAPLYATDFHQNKGEYVYAAQDVDITGVGLSDWQMKTRLCLNGKTITGSINKERLDLYIFDCGQEGQGGKITAYDDYVVYRGTDALAGDHYYTQMWNGTLERTGTKAGPVIEPCGNDGDIILHGGTVRQNAPAPALIASRRNNIIDLRSGTIKTDGQPAVAFTETAENALLKLIGNVVLDVGDTAAHIVVSKPEQIVASYGKDKQYTGAQLRIDCSKLNSLDVVVTGVTEENKNLFVPLDPTSRLLCINDKLVLIKADHPEGELTFNLGAGVTGDAPAPMPGYQNMPVRLPEGLKNGEEILIGWDDGTAKYTPGESYKPSGKPTVLTAIWGQVHKHGNYEFRPVYSLHSIEDFPPVEYQSSNVYAVQPFDLTGHRYLNVYTSLDICFNGQALTGTVSAPESTLYLRDDAGKNGSLTATDAPVIMLRKDGSSSIDVSESGSVTLVSGTLRRTGAKAGPIVEMHQEEAPSSYYVYLEGGSVDQQTDAPAFGVSNLKQGNFHMELRSGTIKTSSQSAIVIPNFRYAEVRLKPAGEGESLHFEVPEGKAHIVVSAPGQITANNGSSTPEYYNGETIIIDCAALQNNDIAVKGVSNDNYMKFKPLDGQGIFVREDNNLHFVDSSVPHGELTFDIGDASGETPAPVMAYQGVAARLPDATGFRKEGYQFRGWMDADGNIYGAGASYVSADGSAKAFTAQWTEIHRHPAYNADDVDWMPINTMADLANLEWNYFYLTKDMDMTGYTNRSQSYCLCLNGKTLSGGLEVQAPQISLFNCHETPGKVLAQAKPALTLASYNGRANVYDSILERTGAAGPAVLLNGKYASLTLGAGAEIRQHSAAPAIQTTTYSIDITLRDGAKITTDNGQPAVALCSSSNNVLHLSGAPVLDVGATAAHIVVQGAKQIDADGKSSTTPYSGAPLRIDTTKLHEGEVVVFDVTDDNAALFTTTTEGKTLAREGDNLVLRTFQNLTFDVNGAEGQVEDLVVYKDQSIALPDDTGLTKAGHILIGWTANGQDYLPGSSYAFTDTETVHFTAKWAQTPAQENGVYQLNTQDDLMAFINIANTVAPNAKAKLNADLEMDEACHRIGTADNPFTGELDGGGKRITVSLKTTQSERGGVFDCIGAGAYIHDLIVTGTLETSNTHFGGIVGRISGGTEPAKLERCVSSVIIRSSAAGENGSGGIFGLNRGSESASSALELTDCVFNGQMTATNGGTGFGGLGGSGDTVTVKNCLMSGNVMGLGSGCDTPMVRGTFTAENCYYLKQGKLQDTEGCVGKLEREMADGQLCRVLNGGRQDGPWLQTLTGEAADKAPTMGTGHEKVLQVTLKVQNGTWNGTKTDDKVYYMNPGKLSAIPTGMQPAAGYRDGFWSADPTVDITDDVIFTYAFHAPWAENVTCDEAGVHMTLTDDLGNVRVAAAIYQDGRMVSAGVKDVREAKNGMSVTVELPANSFDTVKLFLLDQNEAPARQEILKEVQ